MGLGLGLRFRISNNLTVDAAGPPSTLFIAGQYGVCVLSHFSPVRLFVILWTAAHQAPLSMGFSRPEYWSGLPYPPPRDLPNQGIKPQSPTLQADSLPAEPQGKPHLDLSSEETES